MRPIFDRHQRTVGHVSDLFRTLANSPKMMRAWDSMLWPLRSEPTVSRALRELAIMRAAQVAGGGYVWTHHWQLATEFGVSEAKLRSLKAWATSELFDEVERAVLAYAEAVVQFVDVPDSVFAPLPKHFTNAEIVELTMTISFYAHVNCVTRGLQVHVEPEYQEYLEAL